MALPKPLLAFLNPKISPSSSSSLDMPHCAALCNPGIGNPDPFECGSNGKIPPLLFVAMLLSNTPSALPAMPTSLTLATSAGNWVIYLILYDTHPIQSGLNGASLVINPAKVLVMVDSGVTNTMDAESCGR
jgi:hypothetical protein